MVVSFCLKEKEKQNISRFEPRHDKTGKMCVRPAKTQISLGIRPVWSEFSLSAWRKLGSIATHWAHSEDSDQTGRMPRLIWVFAGRTLILLVLSCRGFFDITVERKIATENAMFGSHKNVVFLLLWTIMDSIHLLLVRQRCLVTSACSFALYQIKPVGSLTIMRCVKHLRKGDFKVHGL